MTLAGISLAYLRSRPLASALNLLLLALGVATITVLLLATEQLESRMGRDARGIDLVAGAKGSPMQLVLSAVFHLDAPTGNIPLADANALAKNRMVKKAIPLALGDSYKSFRIVQIRSRLVRDQHARPVHGRARDGSALRFAVRKLRRPRGSTLAQLHLVEHGSRARRILRHPGKKLRKQQVLQHREARHEVQLLRHDAERATAPAI